MYLSIYIYIERERAIYLNVHVRTWKCRRVRLCVFVHAFASVMSTYLYIIHIYIQRNTRTYVQMWVHPLRCMPMYTDELLYESSR